MRAVKIRDSLGEGVLAPGGEGVLVEVLDLGGVVVMCCKTHS